jgi:hypothetical protein
MEVFNIVMLWLGISFLLVGIMLIFAGGRRIDYNTNVKKENEQLEKENKILQNESNRLYSEIEFLNRQKENAYIEQEKAAENYFDILDLTYEAKENEFDAKIHSLQKDYEQALQKEQNSFYNAFIKYVDGLETEYNKAEENFDIQLKSIKQIIQDHQEELDKIQKTYAAAIEAQLREAEIQQSLEFFCLHLTPAEQSTIAMIEELKPRLPEPRVLSMLVWQTFYQKKMNALCLNVLRKATPICGIYKITNRKTGLCYIGQSVDIAKRWKDHAKCGLGIDTPAQNKLYQAMLKDGLTNFTFELLEECERDLLNEKEKFYINLYQACDYGYNSTSGNK